MTLSLVAGGLAIAALLLCLLVASRLTAVLVKWVLVGLALGGGALVALEVVG